MHDGLVFDDCGPGRILLDALAEKWSLLVLHELHAGPIRTGELRRRVDGISEKMLLQTLRKLERFHLVERRSYDETPPHVDYRLTEIGTALSERVRALADWVALNAAALTPDASQPPSTSR